MHLLRRWILKHRIKRAQLLIQKIEDTLCAMNAPRWKRKQIWRDFIKTESGRSAIYSILGEAGK